MTATGMVHPWQCRNARVRSVLRETPDVMTLELVMDDPAAAPPYRFEPGQFNMLYVPGVGEAAISISGDPSDTSSLLHTVRAVGNVTRFLTNMTAGSCLGIRGPLGVGWPLSQCDGKDILLVAGGIGLAPLRPVVSALLSDRHRYGHISLLVGARTPKDLLYRREWSAWQKGIDVQVTVDRADDGWNGHVGVVTTLLDRLPVSRPEQTVLMTCGPEVMMWYSIRAALDRGVRSSAVWLSLERHMNCGVGLCGHCQLGPELLCRDGPVVPFDRVAPFLKVDSL